MCGLILMDRALSALGLHPTATALYQVKTISQQFCLQATWAPWGKDWFSGQTPATIQSPPANSPGSAKELSPEQLAPITQNQLEAFGWGKPGLQIPGLGENLTSI